jgi:hypothetical protein
MKQANICLIKKQAGEQQPTNQPTSLEEIISANENAASRLVYQAQSHV